MQVTLTVSDGTLGLLGPSSVIASGAGTPDQPLVLFGTLMGINRTLTSGLRYQAPDGFFGTATLTIVSDDRGNTGIGNPLTDTDTLLITINGINAGPRVMGIYADSSQWVDSFRDFVDGGFSDASAIGYRISSGESQYQTLPWVNIDRLKIQFSRDVSASLERSDFGLAQAADILAFPAQPARFPSLVSVSYDATTNIATMQFDTFFSAAAIDLKLLAGGIADARGLLLDGEWRDERSMSGSGDGVPAAISNSASLSWQATRVIRLEVPERAPSIPMTRSSCAICKTGLPCPVSVRFNTTRERT